MPDASTGGTGDRGNTRSPGTASANDIIAPGDVRIDVTDSGIATFTTSGGNTLTERIAELRVEGDTVRYIGMCGYSWSVPRTWRSGDTVSDATITWSANTRYARGGYVAAPVTAGTCDCEMCVRSRAQWVNVGTAVTAEGTFTVGGGTYMRPTLVTEQQRVRAEQLRLLQQRQQRERADRERIAWKKRADAADARAEETLRMVLKPDELANYDKTGTIIVTGSDGRRYYIMRGIVGNVTLLGTRGDPNDPVASLCCHPDLYPGAEQNTPLPYKDAYIAQILYLRYALDKFWQTANISWHSIDARNEYLDRRRSRVDSLAGRIFRGQW